jgi:hypothetical protein
MKTVLLISHERSLNKIEGLVNAYKNENIIVLVDQQPKLHFRPYMEHVKTVEVVRGFDIVNAVKRIPHADIVWCVSENLLPVQAQLESFYGIENITPFAAEILSNKQLYDDFCRSIGLGDYVPVSVTPTFHKQLDRFKNKELFSKPDIGTGSNVFFPGDDQSSPSVEYRRWNNRHHFLKYITDKGIHNKFFDLNKKGIHNDRFNNKPCRIMFQEYHWSKEPSICPYGYVVDGKVKILYYVKNSKIKYGDNLDPNSTPIESHSVSEVSDIVRERAVWISMHDEIDADVRSRIEMYMNTFIEKLRIKNIFFAGPDFHVCDNDKLISIDFNPRPGQFINVLDSRNDYKIISNMINDQPINIKNKVLWGCAVLQPGVIKKVKDTSHIQQYFNLQNTVLEPGVVIPKFQNLQDKRFNFNLDITGNNEQELFDNYIKINQLLQECIVME